MARATGSTVDTADNTWVGIIMTGGTIASPAKVCIVMTARFKTGRMLMAVGAVKGFSAHMPVIARGQNTVIAKPDYSFGMCFVLRRMADLADTGCAAARLNKAAIWVKKFNLLCGNTVSDQLSID